MCHVAAGRPPDPVGLGRHLLLALLRLLPYVILLLPDCILLLPQGLAHIFQDLQGKLILNHYHQEGRSRNMSTDGIFSDTGASDK